MNDFFDDWYLFHWEVATLNCVTFISSVNEDFEKLKKTNF